MASKPEGGEWVMAKGEAALAAAALAIYQGQPWEPVPDAEIKRFFRDILGILESYEP